MKRRTTVLTATAFVAALALTATAVAPVAATAGCTPGYWKQEQHFVSWPAGLTPGDYFNETFTSVHGVVTYLDPTATLLDALQLKGNKDGINAYLRHAVAALLNAETFGDDYAASTDWIKWQVFLSQSETRSLVEWRKDHLDADNSIYCPLN